MMKLNGIAARALILATVSPLFLAVGSVAQPPAPSGPRVALPAEQTTFGASAAPRLVASFEGLGRGFTGPQGRNFGGSPSDSSLAVGPNHIVQIVNSRMAIYTKKGAQFGETGRPLYGPVPANNIFRGFGGPCEEISSGDGVARYDQLAGRWLVVLPIFTRLPKRAQEPAEPVPGKPTLSLQDNPNQPGPAALLYQPAAIPQEPAPQGRMPERRRQAGDGSYAICYAVSATSDPLGGWYRYEFERPYFPDYPRPAIWPDGYYVPTSTGDTVIQRHACVAEREKMLQGKPAREICIVVNGVNFLNNADVDGKNPPPPGAPNIVAANGGTQLKGVTKDDGIYFWKYHVDWRRPERTTLTGPIKVAVAPYEYLCEGQLKRCVPQPRTDMRIDSQGDKLMQRFTYRRIGDQESLVTTHSVTSSAGAGAVRWYEFRLEGANRDPVLHQQGSFAPDASYRWLASAAMDKFGNIGMGYSFGDAQTFVGQRFAGRLANDPPGRLGAETVLAHGEAAQTTTLRWEDYVTIAIDPDDDCTMWYTGDFLRIGDAAYSSRIGAFQLGQCGVGGS